MHAKFVSPTFMVSPQLQLSDLEAACAKGVKSVINVRPDNEGADQPLSDDVGVHARALGLDYAHLPVSGGNLTDEHIDEFGRFCEAAEAPVLGFCASGMRAIALWALVESKTRDVDAVLATAAQSGYDLSGLRNKLLALNEANRNLDDIGGQPTS